MLINLCFFVDFFLVDHSRVRLTTVDGIAGSDYINANFCDVSVTSGNYVSDKVLILLTAAYLQHPSQPKQNILFLFMGCYHETSNPPSRCRLEHLIMVTVIFLGLSERKCIHRHTR